MDGNIRRCEGLRSPASDPMPTSEAGWGGASGGTIHAVEKTTVYLPDDLKAAVKRAARERGISEAEVIRESIRSTVGSTRPRPRGGLYTGTEPIARRAEELLAGFGER